VTGQVKLLDFGIAKLLADESTPARATQLTLEGGSALTPQFAAPEQVTGGAVSTATDIYALGVLFYVLLTGKNPVGEQRAPADLVKAIVETEAPRASDTAASADSSVAQKRAATPDKLGRQLRGDLDTIIRKALKKNPAERYGSVTTLADDLQRYLKHEPISARPDTFTYRVGKFVRRNRLAVALTSVAAMAIIAGVTGTAIQSRTARMQRDIAFRQLARAERMNNFNQFLLTDARASNTPLTVDELLNRAQQIVEHENYSDDPANHVELLISIAEQYSNRNESATQRRLLQEAYEISRRLQNPSTRANAACALGDALVDEAGKDNARAEALIQEGLRELPNDSQYALERAFCLWKGGDVAWQNGNVPKALQLDRSAQNFLSTSKLNSSNLKLRILLESGGESMDSHLSESIAAFQRATVLAHELGYDQTRTAGNLYGTTAWALMRAGRPLEAEQFFRRGMDVFGADQLGAWSLQAYAEALRELGRLNEGADYAQRSYQKAIGGSDKVSIIQSMTVLVRIYLDQGNFSRAETTLTQLEGIMRHALPPEHFWFAMVASERSRLAERQKHLTTALQFADQAVTLDEATIKSGGEGTSFLPAFLYQRATVELQTGQPDKAKGDAERALSMLEASLGKDAFSIYIGQCYMALGRALQIRGEADAAQGDFRAAADQFDKALGPDHPQTRAAKQLAGLVKK